MEKKVYQVKYSTAIKWCHNSFILMNEILDIDKNFEENLPVGLEIFQFFITDCSDRDVSFLRTNFPDLLFSYSYKLSKWFLLVDHFGTGWDNVFTDFAANEGNQIMLNSLISQNALEKQGGI